jgi:hypothetical protein
MNGEVVHRRVSVFGRIVRVLVVLSLVVLVGGYFLGWFDFSTNRDESDGDSRIDLIFTINSDEIRRDTEQLKDKVTGLKDAASQAAKSETVAGKVMSVNEATGELVVQPTNSDKSTTLKVDEKTEFALGDGKDSLDRLKEGDEVVVTYVVEDGVRNARKISLRDDKT